MVTPWARSPGHALGPANFLFIRTISRRWQCTSSNLVKNMQTQFFVGASDGQLKLHENCWKNLPLSRNSGHVERKRLGQVEKL